MSLSLIKSAGTGAAWQISCGLVQTVIRLGASTILARRLDPADFGIFGMAYLIYAIFDLFSASGITSGIIVKNKPTSEDLSTCFWSTVLMRLMLFSVLYISSPIIATIMGEFRLAQLIRVVAFLMLITGLGDVSQALIAQALRFKALAIIKLIGLLFESCIAISLALLTNIKYWSLVTGMLAAIFLINVLIIYTAKWRPTFRFNLNSFRYLRKFASNGIAYSIASYLSRNLDYLIVAKMMGATMLGYYQFAYRIPHLINEKISGPIGAVIFPTLAAIKNDDKQFLKHYMLASRYVAWIIFPALGGLAFLSPIAIKCLWGDKWLIVALPMRILCLSAAINGVMDLCRTIFLCKHRPDLPFKFETLSLITAGISISILGYLYGLTGIAIAMVITRMTSLLATYYAVKMLGGGLYEILNCYINPLVSTATMIATLYGLSHILGNLNIHSLSQLAILIGAGILSFAMITYTIFRSEFNSIRIIIRDTLIG
jgi:O-antigen/teichoic acid export membrane protein